MKAPTKYDNLPEYIEVLTFLLRENLSFCTKNVCFSSSNCDIVLVTGENMSSELVVFLNEANELLKEITNENKR